MSSLNRAKIIDDNDNDLFQWRHKGHKWRGADEPSHDLTRIKTPARFGLMQLVGNFLHLAFRRHFAKEIFHKNLHEMAQYIMMNRTYIALTKQLDPAVQSPNTVVEILG